MKKLQLHGLSHHPLYKRWHWIKTRCKREYNNKIKMSDEFANDFMAFYKHLMKIGWTEDKIIDRKDNSKGYERGNLRCTDIITSNNNRSNIRTYRYRGKDYTIRGLITTYKSELSHGIVSKRLQRGWTVRRALTEPRNLEKITRGNWVWTYH